MMEYTVQKLGKMAGISTRTLRYYDEIGILKPLRINSSGYRIYGEREVDQLQQILFYRELGMPLHQIREAVTSPSFDRVRALREHRRMLLDRKEQLEQLITNVERTIASTEGREPMSDQEKFEGFKRKKIEENEEKYGEEIRLKYGDEAVEQSYATMAGMTQEQYEEAGRLAEEVKATLAAAMQKGDPAGELARNAADLHRQWLALHWGHYSREAHAGVAQMYVEDERFKAYYDADKPGTAEFLRDAILEYTGMKQS